LGPDIAAPGAGRTPKAANLDAFALDRAMNPGGSFLNKIDLFTEHSWVIVSASNGAITNRI
jgi:hypothetical protein